MLCKFACSLRRELSLSCNTLKANLHFAAIDEIDGRIDDHLISRPDPGIHLHPVAQGAYCQKSPLWCQRRRADAVLPGKESYSIDDTAGRFSGRSRGGCTPMLTPIVEGDDNRV